MSRPTLFLLSPANLTGIRARQLASPRAAFDAATRYRSAEGVRIDEAFTFMSALYFRGKIAYARRFAVSPGESFGSGIFVMAPGYGLVPPDWRLTQATMKKLKRTKVDPRVRGYRKPLEEHASRLASEMPADACVILLGSIATGKYVDILWPLFGERLLFPISFVGIGDMSRGAIMLRAAANGEELEYSPLNVERHRKRG